MKKLITVLFILSAACVAVYCHAATVTEIYVKPAVILGAPIRLPMRFLPPLPERPAPPTPEERAEMQKLFEAKARFQSALNSALVRAGIIIDMSDIAAISNATERLSTTDIVWTNRAAATYK